MKRKESEPSGIDLIERVRQIAEDLTGLTPMEQRRVLRKILEILEEDKS